MANNFYVWCDDTTNVQSSSTFGSDSERGTGFVPGTPARSIKINTALRQANLIACALTSVLFPDDNTLTVQSSRADVASLINTTLTNKIKATKVDNAGNADTVNNLEIKRYSNGVLKIGDTIIPQKVLLWSGNLTCPGSEDYETLVLGANVFNVGDRIEIVSSPQYSLTAGVNPIVFGEIWSDATTNFYFSKPVFLSHSGNPWCLGSVKVEIARETGTVTLYPEEFVSFDSQGNRGNDATYASKITAIYKIIE